MKEIFKKVQAGWLSIAHNHNITKRELDKGQQKVASLRKIGL